MIYRLIIPILAILLFSDTYIYMHFLRWMHRFRKLIFAVWFTQSLAMIIYGIGLSFTKDFAPENPSWLYTYLLLLSMWAFPKFVFAVCSLLGWGHCLYHKTKTNWGNRVGAVAGVVLALVSVYGYTWGFNTVTVRHETYYSKDLPKSFNGYRIVHFSDAHVGTYTPGRADVLAAAVDSINAQHANMIVFTGDLQNLRPSEVYSHVGTLGKLKAPDGVFSILGNHDYAWYVTAPDSVLKKNCRDIIDVQARMGWTLLRNEHRIVRRNSDSIVVAGMEYEGNNPKAKNYGDLKKSLLGVDQTSAFILMLQHDPTSWRKNILPNSSSQLTLSGHTHGGQIKIFGWSPASLVYTECDGMYHDGKRAINVSHGLGGLVPFRFWCPSEIVVIELKCL